MRIVIIVTGLNNGGAERMLFNLAKSYKEKNHQVHVISLLDGGIYKSNLENIGIDVRGLGMERSRLPKFRHVFKLISHVKEIQPNIIQGWMYHGNLLASIAKFFLPNSVKLFWSVRQTLYSIRKETYLTRVVIYLNIFLSGMPKKIFFNSKLSQIQHEKKGFSKKNTILVPNGIDFESFRFQVSNRHKYRKRYGVANDIVLIGNFSRFHPMKNHEMFFNSLAKLPDNIIKKIKVLMAGNGVEISNPFFYDMQKKFPRDLFVFLGEIKNISEVMNSLDIFCLSSSWGDAFPNILIEALASEVFVVSTNVGDAKEIINDYGYISEINDEEFFSKLLLKSINLNKKNRNEIAKLGSDHVRKNFDIRNISEQYMSYYRSE